jgi:hypothetical protein
MAKRNADESLGASEELRETRQRARHVNEAKDPDDELRRLTREDAEHEPEGKAYCSHCGKYITPSTWVSSFSIHYGTTTPGDAGNNWDIHKGEWKTTCNDLPLKPPLGYDAVSINARMNAFRKRDDVVKDPSRPSHLVPSIYMNGQHDDSHIHVYNDESDSPDESEDEQETDGDDVYMSNDDGPDEFDDKCFDETEDIDPSDGPRSPSSVLDDVPSTINPFHLLLRAWKAASSTTDHDFTTLLQLLKTLEALPEVAAGVPTTTLHTINSALGADQDLFDSICVCGKCGKLYDREACEIRVNGDATRSVTRSRVCCGKALLRKSSPNSTTWTPVLTYPCVDVETALSKILLRPEITTLLDHWKDRQLPVGTYGDLYEGDVWRDFKKWEGVPFLSDRGIGLMLNMDGFQPFKRRQYSVQGIYLAIMNLPRHLRYRRENMILVGLVPGGKEKIPLSHFIERLTDQLVKLWDTPSSIFNRKVALLAVACDVPAGRKLCGMVSHASPRGCSRCDCLHETEKNPKGGPPKICWDKPINADEYGKFPDRTRQAHEVHGRNWKRANTKSAKEEISKDTGYRWTPFLRLVYFDPSRMTLLDPLHNIWEGLFKDLLKQFLKGKDDKGKDDKGKDDKGKDQKVTKLSEKVLTEFETEVGRCKFPRSMGPVLGKIGHKMSRFTGHELKNMLNTFFLWLVDGSITEEEWQLVQHLHQASRIADERFVTNDQIETLEEHLVKYCALYASIYGGNELKPNHHLCRHLAGFMQDYGPTCAFWLFAFERYNGIMTAYNTRASAVETSMFRQYSIQSLIIQKLTSSLTDELSNPDNIISRNLTDDESAVARLLLGDQNSSCGDDTISGVEFDAYRVLALDPWNGESYYKVRGHEKYPGALLNHSNAVLSKDDAILLRSSLTSLHQKLHHTWVKNADFKIGRFHRYSDLSMGGVTYQSGTTARLSHVLFNSASSKAGQVPALVRYYCYVEVDLITGERKLEYEKLTGFDESKKALEDCPWIAGYTKRTFTFARVDWFPADPVGLERTHFEKWSVKTRTDPKFAFIPVARIVSGFVPLLGSSTSAFSCGPLRGHFVF